MKVSEKIILKLGKESNFKKKDLANKLHISRVTLDRKIKEDDWNATDLTILERLGIR